MSENKEVNFQISKAIFLLDNENTEDDNQALALVNEALNEDLSAGNEALAHFVKGTVFFRKKQYKIALKESKLAVAVDPNFSNNKNLTYSILLQLAFIYEEMGKINETILQFDKTIEIMQTYFESNFLLANVHLHFGLFYARHSHIKSSDEKMLMNFQRIIEIDPEFPDVFYYLGLYYLGKSLYHRALENFTKFLELQSPDNSEYNEMRRVALENIEELKQIFE